MLSLMQRASIVGGAAFPAQVIEAAFARSARPQGDRLLLVGAFAVSLLVDLAVNVDASDAAACAAGSAFGTVLAEPKPRVLVGPAGGAEVPVTQGLAASLVSTDVPHIRLTGVVAPLVLRHR